MAVFVSAQKRCNGTRADSAIVRQAHPLRMAIFISQKTERPRFLINCRWYHHVDSFQMNFCPDKGGYYPLVANR